MAYRLRWELFVDWIGPGSGPMGNTVGLASGVQGQMAGAQGASGMAQTLSLNNSINSPYPPIIAGSGTGGAIATADITTLIVGAGTSPYTGSVAADMLAQLNQAGNLARLQGFASGGG
jgi:hypothetical protein